MPTSKVVTRADLKAILDEVLPSVAVDYVVEQGTSGTWKYRKWSNGIAECWQYVQEPNLAMTSAEGYAYFASAKRYDFPSSLFASPPTIQFSAESSGSLVHATLRSSNESKVDVYYSCSRSVTETVWGHIYAIGRWK